jgi:hypothetical protein
VVVGRQNMGELPAPLFQVVGNGTGVRCVDGYSGAGDSVVDKHAIIVVAADELVNIKMGHE